MPSRWLAGTAVLLAALALSRCGTSPTDPGGGGGGTPTAPDFIRAISSGGSSGSLKTGAQPVPGGGPAILIRTNDTVINGGSTLVQVAAAAPLTRVLMYVDGETGFFEVGLPGATASTTLIVSFQQRLPRSSFRMVFLGVGTDGKIGASAAQLVGVTAVGTGDLQVSVSWDADSDVDLHVVDPSGEELFYGQRVVSSGGVLDLSSNSGCGLDGVKNENAFWASGTAPSGTYRVRVDYWSACGELDTNFVVTILDNRGLVRVVTNRFTGIGDFGGLGAGLEVAAFTR